MLVTNVFELVLPGGKSLRNVFQNGEDVDRRHGSYLQGVHETGMDSDKIAAICGLKTRCTFAIDDTEKIRGSVTL
jgi:hypothetical protein